MNAKICATEMTDFINELNLLLEENIPLAEALNTLRQHQPKRLQRFIDEIHAENGNLATVLARYPQAIEPFLVDTLRNTSKPAVTLREIAEFREFQTSLHQNLRTQLFNSFSYFLAVLTIFLVIATVMLGWVAPAFADIFSEFGADIPYLTQILLKISFFVQNNFVILAPSFLILLVIFWKFRTHLLPSFPIFGHLYRKLALIDFLHVCTFMLSHGVSLNLAVTTATQATGNLRTFSKLKQQVNQGMALSEALSHAPVPKKLCRIAAIGEKTNKLDKLLAKFLLSHKKQLESDIQPTLKLLGVALTVILGILVGTFVIALYLPIFYAAGVI
jgi:type IV pilus assembly protein PilC